VTSSARSSQYNLIELVLAVLFAGAWAGVASRTWDSFFGFHLVVGTAILMFPSYLITILIIRRYRNGGRDRRPSPDDR
jgi:hypothetical protein